MALSERYWIAGAVAACAMIAVAKLPPDLRMDGRRRNERLTPEMVAHDRARTRVRQESEVLALLERRDSALVLAARAEAPAPGMPRVLHARDIPTHLHTRIDAILAREIAGMGRPFGAAPVVVFVTTDTARAADASTPERSSVQWIEPQYVLPPATDGRTCLSIVRVGRSALDARDDQRPVRLQHRRIEDSHRWIEGSAGKLLGPCAYFGAHGMPGDSIADWLADRRFAVALRAPAPETDSLRADMPPELARTTMVGRFLTRAGWAIGRDHLSPTLVRCAGGDAAQCLQALASGAPDRPRRDSPWLLRSSGVSFTRYESFADRFRLGPSEPWFLATLHDEIGADAFGRFWRSGRAPDVAYAEAAGTPLTEAASRWARATYDIGEQRRWPHPLAFALQLALVAGLLGGSLALRQRRTVAA